MTIVPLFLAAGMIGLVVGFWKLCNRFNWFIERDEEWPPGTQMVRVQMVRVK